jgi:hypothetical protein
MKKKHYKQEVKNLRKLMGALYQVLRVHNASEQVMDVVSLATVCMPSKDEIDSILPYSLPEDAPDFALGEVLDELKAARKKFNEWPLDPIHAYGVLAEECGELGKELMQLTYKPERSSMAAVRSEAVQTAAMALRFLQGLEKYKFEPSETFTDSEL